MKTGITPRRLWTSTRFQGFGCLIPVGTTNLPLFPVFGVDGVPFTAIITKDGKWYRVKLDSPRAIGKHFYELLGEPLPQK